MLLALDSPFSEIKFNAVFFSVSSARFWEKLSNIDEGLACDVTLKLVDHGFLISNHFANHIAN